MRGEFQDWESDALCKQVGTEIFYPESPQGDDYYSHAKKVCRRCKVREQCLERALRDEERDGMWGGLTPKDRLVLLRRRRGTGFRWAKFDDGVPKYCGNGLHLMEGSNVAFDGRGKMCVECGRIADQRNRRRRR